MAHPDTLLRVTGRQTQDRRVARWVIRAGESRRRRIHWHDANGHRLETAILPASATTCKTCEGLSGAGFGRASLELSEDAASPHGILRRRCLVCSTRMHAQAEYL